jgi:outer membrane protein assembly factor BamB
MGDVTDANRLWRVSQRNELPQRIGTGVVFDDKLYAAGETVIQCIDMKTGRELWRHRPPGASFWSPTVATADGRIYITSQQGTTYVIRADAKEFKIISANELKERTNSSPAIAGGRIYIRTFQNLYCIGE